MIPMRVLLDVEETPIVAPEERSANPELGAVSAVGILTAGTEEGRPVVIIRIDREDGTFVCGQTTLRLMHTAMLAFMAKYGDLV